MKKNYLLLLLLFCFTQSYAQKFAANFLGEDFKRYKGKLFKINNQATSFLHTFYERLEYLQSSYDNHVIYPEKEYKFNTTKDSLINRVFKVEDIVNKTGAPYTGETYLENPIFILADTLTKQKIYYKYDAKYEHSFPFLTSPISYNEVELCADIEKNVDEFTGETKWSTPMSNRFELSRTILYKYAKKGKVNYYLSLRTTGSTLNVNEAGVIILFTDGTRFSRNIKIDVEADKDGYEYSAFIPLVAADLIAFSTKTIKKFRLYIYDESINNVEADKFKIYVKCLRKKH